MLYGLDFDFESSYLTFLIFEKQSKRITNLKFNKNINKMNINKEGKI